MLSGSALNLQRAADLMSEFIFDARQKRSEVQCNGHRILKATRVKILGVAWMFAGGHLHFTVYAEKVADARAKGNTQLLSLRNVLNGCLVMSKVMYGVQVQGSAPGDERRLRMGRTVMYLSDQRKRGGPSTITTGQKTANGIPLLHEMRKELFFFFLWSNLKSRRRCRGGGFVEHLLYTTKRLGISSDVSVEKLELTLAGTSLDASNVPMVLTAAERLREVFGSEGHRQTKESSGRRLMGLCLRYRRP